MTYAWYPHPGPQQDFCSRWEDEVLYGGAKGGGKTDAGIVEATRHIQYPDYKALILRRTHPQLEEILDRTKRYYPLVGGNYIVGEHRWHFPSGAKIKLGHCEHNGSEYNYWGHEYQYIYFDQSEQFIPKQIALIVSCCRSTNPNIPKRVRHGANPGGPSHQYLKDRFRIGLVPPGTTFKDETEIMMPNGTKYKMSLHRVFIPAFVTDNPSLWENDPEYVARLMQLPELEKRRLLYGEWDAFEGQKFEELNREVHGYDDDLPVEWEAFGAFDWGYARPWVYCIFRVDYDGRLYLDKLHYALKKGSENVGLRQTDTEIARKIREVETEAKVKVRWRVAGADIFNPKRKQDGMIGPSPAEEMGREGINFIKADDTRIIGWQQIHHRLRVDEEGLPWLYIRKDLDHAWRTILGLREDPKNPEDIVTRDIEDHIPEAIRYACMTRPMKPRQPEKSDAGSFQAERRRYLKAKKLATRKGISLTQAYGRI